MIDNKPESEITPEQINKFMDYFKEILDERNMTNKDDRPEVVINLNQHSNIQI